MKTSKGKGRAAQPGAGRRKITDRQLVLLEQGPLRRRAASECSRQMARLEKAKAEWIRFLSEDRAGFDRWMAASFGALLTRLREIEAVVSEKEALLREVEAEMIFGGARNPRAAYARVQRRRDDAPPPGQGDGCGDMPEGGQERLFEDFLRVVMGMNPDRMSERKYAQMFADFQANVLGQRPEPSPAAVPPATQNRVKELYRRLVRRLHPDTKAATDAEVSALWHEVQDAYGAGNADRLEMLLAMTDLQSNEAGEHTTLFQMRSVLTELRRSFNTLQCHLRDARRDPAWNFARRPDRAELAQRVRGDLESKLQWKAGELRHMEALLASWTPAKARRKPARSSQQDFLF